MDTPHIFACTFLRFEAMFRGKMCPNQISSCGACSPLLIGEASSQAKTASTVFEKVQSCASPDAFAAQALSKLDQYHQSRQFEEMGV